MTNPFRNRNVIKPHPYQYNVGIIGESGIGKTSIMVEALEKLVGWEGYLLLNCGREDGVSAIADAEYADIRDFVGLQKFVNHVVKNKDTEWADLKVVVLDTIDEVYKFVDKEVVRLHNKDNASDKQVKSVNGAFGGYGSGGDKALEILFEELDKLHSVGVQYWWVAHTKRKSNTDIATGTEYEKLTAKLNSKYFEEFKTKSHFMGVASVDREIEVEKKKNKMGGGTTDKGVVLEESRRITFRDDDYNIDSKSRFADIEAEIDLDADAFIKAMYDAINKEKAKEKDKRPSRRKQEEVKEVEEKKVETPSKVKEEVKEAIKEEPKKEEIDQAVDEAQNKKLLASITKAHKASGEAVQDEAMQIIKDAGFESLKEWKEIPTALLEKVLKAYTE